MELAEDLVVGRGLGPQRRGGAFDPFHPAQVFAHLFRVRAESDVIQRVDPGQERVFDHVAGLENPLDVGLEDGVLGRDLLFDVVDVDAGQKGQPPGLEILGKGDLGKDFFRILPRLGPEIVDGGLALFHGRLHHDPDEPFAGLFVADVGKIHPFQLPVDAVGRNGDVFVDGVEIIVPLEPEVPHRRQRRLPVLGVCIVEMADHADPHVDHVLNPFQGHLFKAFGRRRHDGVFGPPGGLARGVLGDLGQGLGAFLEKGDIRPVVFGGAFHLRQQGLEIVGGGVDRGGMGFIA